LTIHVVKMTLFRMC